MIPDALMDALIQAGGVALVTAIFLFYQDRQDKRTNTLISNHLQHSSEAMKKMSNALTKLTSTIESLKGHLVKK